MTGYKYQQLIHIKLYDIHDNKFYIKTAIYVKLVKYSHVIRDRCSLDSYD